MFHARYEANCAKRIVSCRCLSSLQVKLCLLHFAYEKWANSNLTISFRQWNWFGFPPEKEYHTKQCIRYIYVKNEVVHKKWLVVELIKWSYWQHPPKQIGCGFCEWNLRRPRVCSWHNYANEIPVVHKQTHKKGGIFCRASKQTFFNIRLHLATSAWPSQVMLVCEWLRTYFSLECWLRTIKGRKINLFEATKTECFRLEIAKFHIDRIFVVLWPEPYIHRLEQKT